MRKFKLSVSLLVVIALAFTGVVAQSNDDRVLLTIAGDDITAGEFMYVYEKNNFNQEASGPEAIREYLDLYINFRLKVREAEDLGMDTSAAFIRELDGYRKQLAQPYFTDQAVYDRLLREAYDRKQFDLRASHILFRVDKNAPPADTLKAYQNAMNALQRINNGVDFGQVAAELSEDPSARDTEASQQRPARKGNLGDLGYFTVFDMVYPFENGAYTSPVGQVSAPVRTDFGYHLIKVTDKQPALGQAQVAHIYVAIPPNANALDSLHKKTKIDGAFEKLKSGVPFEEVVQEYSEDRSSAVNGGKLPWFGSNRMVPEFIAQTRNLKDSGDVSEPFITPFGWHIIMLMGRKPIGSYEEEEFGIKSRLDKDQRSKMSQQAVIQRIKNDYGFKDYPKARDAVYMLLDSAVLKGEWDAKKAAGMNKTVMSLGEKKLTQFDLAKYLASKQSKKGAADIFAFFNENYNSFIVDQCLDYEDKQLEKKYPEFRNLVREYHDGILLFDLTDRKVWSKAVKDTTGLRQFYAGNPGKYMWGQRLQASLFTVTNPGAVKIDELKKKIGSGTDPQKILSAYNSDTTLNVIMENGKYSSGDSPVIDKIEWKTGISSTVDTPEGPAFAFVQAVLAPEPKSIDEARGLITADYQSYLEQLWIEELRSKYAVSVNQEVLSTLK